jgi:hypothetical protein
LSFEGTLPLVGNVTGLVSPVWVTTSGSGLASPDFDNTYTMA